MQIQVVNVSVEDKGKYKQAEVFFKKQDGSAGNKKLMSFGAGAKVFNKLKDAKQGDNYDIVCVKNDKGFWDWTDFNDGSGAAPAATSSAAAAGHSTPSRSFETAEERHLRQQLIVKQSSITAAITLLSLNNPKGGVLPKQVLEVADVFNNYVWGKSSTPTTDSIAELEDDVL